jgi:2-polyprenyl-6-methoxyphenol hydroxylase-like FAD-dependent oxidoreductase
MNRQADILVVGAGPAGLTLALQAHDHGARVRIVERRPDAFRPSRALILHPRTLEVLRPLGVTEALLARANIAPEAQLHFGARVVPVRLDNLALTDTAFPHLSLVRQMDVETVLAKALADRGIDVERGTELIDVVDGDAFARATLQSPDGVEATEASFVVGCDGQESTVRRQAGIEWHGAPYVEEVVLADIELDGVLEPGVAHVAMGPRGLIFVFALGEQATWRLLATRPADLDSFPFGQPGPSVPQAELQALLDDAGLEARISSLVWAGRYRLQHRLAARFRRGRLFLAGDAAHAHSPATGQGMNTGIQDAVNLGWKLAFAPAAKDPEFLLASYELERRPVARRLLALTHLAFLAEASSNSLISLVRGVLAPLGAPLAPTLAGQRSLVAEVIRVISQWRMGYTRSPLSVEAEPRRRSGPRAGRRLPDAGVTCDGETLRLHALLAGPGVHVMLDRDAPPLERGLFGPHVSTHRLSSSPGSGVVAVRPDGYVGFRSGIARDADLRSWLETVGAQTTVDSKPSTT